MPEYYEFETDGEQINIFIEDTKPENLVLQAIHLDATEKETNSACHPLSRASSGHVYQLDSSSTVKRGGAVKDELKTLVFPPKFATPSNAPSIPISSHGLLLVGVEKAPRATILEFREKDFEGPSYWCQIQLFTHTNVQVFTLDEWNNAICKVDRSTRGFKVGFAFEFGTHVLAWLSLDLLVQLHWSNSRTGLPHSTADIVTNHLRFLQELVTWMKLRRKVNSPRLGNAMNQIRQETSIFGGAGVYTIQEIFHRAGLSPNLSEFEIFDNPSRTARLVGAYYDFCLQAQTNARAFIKPFMLGFLRACRREDRALYSHQLMVYGKDRTNHSKRFKVLLQEYNTCLENQSTSQSQWVRIHGAPNVPFDVFEPDHIRNAILSQDLQLGALIFGDQQWKKLALDNKLAFEGLDLTNPLLEYFSGIEFNCATTWLHSAHYTHLFSPITKHQGMTSWSRPNLYRMSNTNIWSVIPMYPALSAPNISSSLTPLSRRKKIKESGMLITATAKIKCCNATTRASLLLQNVTQHTEVYTVGPLDFCGVAQIITGPGGTNVIMVCKMDPRKSLYCIQRHILGAATAKLKGKGLEKKGLDLKVKKSLLKNIRKRSREDDVENKENSHVQGALSLSSSLDFSLDEPMKKKRRSADRDILTQLHIDITTDPIFVTTSLPRLSRSRSSRLSS